MKQIFRKTILLLFGGLFVSNAAWADNSKTLGNNENTTPYLGAQNRYTLAPNKTLSLTFTNYAGTLNFYNWDIVIVDKDVVFDDSDINKCYVRYRADNFGDGPKFNDSYNGCTWDWGTFLTHLNGATVNLTIEREGSTIKYRAIATKGAVSYEQNYRTYNVGDGTQDIDVILTIDHSHLTFEDDSAANGVISDTSIAGSNVETVGSRDNTSLYNVEMSKVYIVEPNKSLKLSLKNYSSKLGNYANCITFVSDDLNRYSGATAYIALRLDNWDNIQNSNAGISSNFDFSGTTFVDEMNGATINLTVSRTGASVKVRYDIVASNSTIRYEEYTKDCGDGSQNIRVYLVPDHSHFEIYPETIEINTIDWSTFVSANNLDFSQAQDGLSAYAITGISGSAITKEAVTGIVPAGTPLLVSGTANASYTVPVATTAGSAPEGNLLKAGDGSAVGYVEGKTRYVLSKDDYDNPVFKKLAKGGSSATVPVGKAYLEFTGDVPARELTFDFDSETTAISNLTPSLSKGEGEYFDLQGRKVANPTKGLYIVNGKKVILH